MLVRLAAAAAELLRRRRARNSLAEYARSIEIPGSPLDPEDAECEAFRTVETALAQHHLLICDEVQRCIETYSGLLMLFFPPGSAKSTYATVVATTWAMGKFPDSRTIITGYGADIAEKQSRRARSICKQLRFKSIWHGAQLQSDQRAVNEWKLSNNSEMLAAGILGGVTGNRADLIVIDDPVKNQEEADSETDREKKYDEYINSVLTRMKPGCSLILIMTRWHEDDLAGRILPEGYGGESGDILCQDGQVWRVINVPAKAELPDDPLGRKVGEYLWPQWFRATHWAKWELNKRAKRTWAALFQQRPRPEEGIAFNRGDAKWYDPTKPNLPPPGTPGYGTRDNPCGPPVVVRRFGASDYATLEEAKADKSEHGVAGIDHQGNMIFEHWWSGQKETDKSIEAFIEIVQLFKNYPRSAQGIIKWWNEGGTIDKAIKPAINRAMRESKPHGTGFVPIEAMPSIKDKGTKLLSFHARYAAGSTYWPINQPWADEVIDQLVGFGAVRFDDKADVCGLLGRGIDQMGDQALPAVNERKEGLKPFTKAWIMSGSEQKAPEVRYFA